MSTNFQMIMLMLGTAYKGRKKNSELALADQIADSHSSLISVSKSFTIYSKKIVQFLFSVQYFGGVDLFYL